MSNESSIVGDLLVASCQFPIKHLQKYPSTPCPVSAKNEFSEMSITHYPLPIADFRHLADDSVFLHVV
ncbi:MAG: hypothetical protein D6728_03080 [Cyanobacteria bacterium J055]|nr:MAG: hypothetical protein D6728_03080 [Cyanobacteria bacterium J055]